MMWCVWNWMRRQVADDLGLRLIARNIKDERVAMLDANKVE